MKTTIWTIAIMLAALLALGITSAVLSQGASRAFWLEAENLETLLLQEDWEPLLRGLDRMEERWEKSKDWLQLLINHGDTDDINLAMGKLRAGIVLQDKSLSLWAIQELKESCLHLYHRDALRLTNII